MSTKSGKRSGRRTVSKTNQTVTDSNRIIDFDATVINCSINKDGMFGTYAGRKVRYIEGSCCLWEFVK